MNRRQVTTADVSRSAIERMEGQLALVRTLLEDLRSAYPHPAPYGVEATTIERLEAILDGGGK